ncbi:MAG: dockerin type I domain-containing protein [Phycisphaerae bacterium]
MIRRSIVAACAASLAMCPAARPEQPGKLDSPMMESAALLGRVSPYATEPTISDRGAFFDIFNQTQECSGNGVYFRIQQSSLAAITTDRVGVIIGPTGGIQDSGVSTGGSFDRIVLRYATGMPGPFSAARFDVHQDASMGIDRVGRRMSSLAIAGLPGDETPSDGFSDQIELTIDLNLSFCTAVNLVTGTTINLPVFDPTGHLFVWPIWLERGAFGFSMHPPAEAFDWGPVLAFGGVGGTDAMRLLDSSGRMAEPDTRFFFGGLLCPTRPQSSMWLRLQSVSPPPNLVLADSFNDSVVASNYTPIGAALLSESGGSLVVNTPGVGEAGFAFRFNTPLAGEACNVLLGANFVAVAQDAAIQLEIITTAFGGGDQADVTARIIQKGQAGSATDPCRLNIVVTDKNGKKQIFTIEGKKLADIDSSWFDKVGTQRQFEIRFKDGSRWNSPLVDPPNDDLAGFNLTTTGTQISVAAHMVEDTHRVQLNYVSGTATVASLAPTSTDGFNAQILLGSHEIDVRNIAPESLYIHSVHPTGGFVLGATPAVAPGNSVQYDDNLLTISLTNAPLRFSIDPSSFVISAVLGDGRRFFAGTRAVLDPDPFGTMTLADLYQVDPVDLTVSGSVPHVADGVDLATITVLALSRETGLPVDGLDLRGDVSLPDGDGEAEYVLVPLGGGGYQLSLASSVAGLVHVSVYAVGTLGFGDTHVQFLADTPTQMDVSATSSQVLRPGGFLLSSAPTETYVQLLDANGNPAIINAGDLIISTPPNVEATVTPVAQSATVVQLTLNCDGYLPASALEIFHLPTGLSETVIVSRPVLGPARLADNPIWTGGETFVISLELTVDSGWNASNWTIPILLDTGLTAIGQVSFVQDGDPFDSFQVLPQTVPNASPCSEQNLLVSVVRVAPPIPGQSSAARIDVVIEPRDTSSAPYRDVTGLIVPQSISSNAVHPSFGTTTIAANDDTVWIPVVVCSLKSWMFGCIIYVRGDVPAGKAQVTKEQLCASHNLINDVWKQACIAFRKEYCDIIVSGKINGKDITESIPKEDAHYAKVNQAARDALDACGINPGAKCLIYLHVQAQTGLNGTTRATGIGGRNVTVHKGKRDSRTSPHEVGHCLGLEHPDPPVGDNLMTPSGMANAADNTNLNAAQIAAARGSPFLNKFIIPIYFCYYVPFSSVQPSPDGDGDGADDACDTCPATANPDQGDADLDRVGNDCDNCPSVSNRDQHDDDGNGVGDACQNCPGDVDGDNDVDLTDLSRLLSNFGVASGATRGMGDLNGDGDVDLSDLSMLLANFGAACS